MTPADQRAPVIRVRDVVREYRQLRTSLIRARPVVPALRGVSLDVQPGERFGIVGASGCGKSTLLRILAGVESVTSGSVEIFGAQTAGRAEKHLGDLRRRLQLVLQDPMSSLDPRMRIGDIIAEPLVAQGKTGRVDRVASLLQQVGMPADAARRFPHQFSGGQRQRISIARAIAPQPDVLLADEPVSGLDVSVRAQVLNLITDLVGELSLTLVFVSHDLSVVSHLCDRIAVIDNGHVVESGPPDQIYREPQHPYTRRLIAAIPSLQNALAGQTAAMLAATELQEIATPEAGGGDGPAATSESDLTWTAG